MADLGWSVVFVFLVKLSVCAGEITCKDANGNPVDWFVMYKLPKQSHSKDPLTREGLGYYYMDVNSQHWTLGSTSLNGTEQALYYTLQQVYKNVGSQDVMYIFYNDEDPKKEMESKYGHTKGDISFDDDGGFWLVHSLPRFPPYSNWEYFYPESGTHYGQTFLCVTYPSSHLDDIGKQLLYTYPQIYNSSLPSRFVGKYPTIARVLNGEHVDKRAVQHSKVTLTSQGGQDFTSFAKFSYFDADLYANFVAPELRSALYVESWQHGDKTNDMPTNCSADYWVYNIARLQVSATPFKETTDHAKWAITTKPGVQYICIGDINRQYSQEVRSGGTVCSLLPKVWQAFNSSVTQVDPCPKPRQIPELWSVDSTFRRLYMQD